MTPFVIFPAILVFITSFTGTRSVQDFKTLCSHDVYDAKRYPAGLWVSTKVSAPTYEAAYAVGYARLKDYQRNELGSNVEPIVGQARMKNGKTPYVFSFFIPANLQANPPLPANNKVFVDRQGQLDVFSMPFGGLIMTHQILDLLETFKETLKGKSFSKDWYMVAEFDRPGSSVRERELWLATSPSPNTCDLGMTLTKSKRVTNPSFCKGRKCPPYTLLARYSNGIELRDYDNFTVISKTFNDGTHCNYTNARFLGYMANHRYFSGQNSAHKRINRTLPVITLTEVKKNQTTCPNTYSMLFYLSTNATHNASQLPVPSENGVSLKSLSGLKVYVKVFFGSNKKPREWEMRKFRKDLSNLKLPFETKKHYLAAYAGHGPRFGRRVELWYLMAEKKPVS